MTANQFGALAVLLSLLGLGAKYQIVAQQPEELEASSEITCSNGADPGCQILRWGVEDAPTEFSRNGHPIIKSWISPPKECQPHWVAAIDESRDGHSVTVCIEDVNSNEARIERLEKRVESLEKLVQELTEGKDIR